MEAGRGQGGDRLRLPHDRHASSPTQASHDMDEMVRDEGVTSFKLFMAYPGVFMVDDATIFKALPRTRENGGADLHARRERRGDRRPGARRRWRKGQTAPEVPRAHPARRAPRRRPPAAPSPSPRWRACRSTSSTSPARDALEKVKQARDMGLPAYAETCPQYLFLSVRRLRAPGLRGRQVRDVAAAAREVEPGRALEGARRRTTCRWSPPTTARSA